MIEVNYESDDYAYVQDKRAMQMFDIAGLGNSSNFSPSNQLYTTVSPNFQDSTKHNRYVYVKLPSAMTSANAQNEIARKYFEGVKQIYFRCAVLMYPSYQLDPELAEYVPGYCQFESYGICPNDNGVMWIKLKGKPLGNSGSEVVNPITKAAWQFLRINLPFLAYPGSQNNDVSFVSIIKALIAPLFDVQNIFLGYSRSCMTKQWAQGIVLGKSWIRLDNPDSKNTGEEQG